jgi:hypothetical protein
MAALGAQLAINGANTYTQAQAQRSQSRYEQRIAEANARIMDLQARDATQRGEEAADASQRATRQLVGSQRAAMAAQGIDVASGSALDVQEATAGLGALDALTIRNNAYREAWGFQMQALNSRSEAAHARSAGRQAVRNTLLEGGLGAARDYAAYSARSGPAGPRGGAPGDSGDVEYGNYPGGARGRRRVGTDGNGRPIYQNVY